MPDWAIDAAIDVVDSDLFKGLMAVDRVGKCSEMVASALLSAYRRGVEDSAKVAEGFQAVPRLFPHGGTLTENEAAEAGQEFAQDEIAASIRRLGEAE